MKKIIKKTDVKSYQTGGKVVKKTTTSTPNNKGVKKEVKKGVKLELPTRDKTRLSGPSDKMLIPGMGYNLSPKGTYVTKNGSNMKKKK